MQFFLVLFYNLIETTVDNEEGNVKVTKSEHDLREELKQAPPSLQEIFEDICIFAIQSQDSLATIASKLSSVSFYVAIKIFDLLRDLLYQVLLRQNKKLNKCLKNESLISSARKYLRVVYTHAYGSTFTNRNLKSHKLAQKIDFSRSKNAECSLHKKTFCFGNAKCNNYSLHMQCRDDCVHGSTCRNHFLDDLSHIYFRGNYSDYHERAICIK